MSTPRIIQRMLAKVIAGIMYKPFGSIRPSRKTVFERDVFGNLKVISFQRDRS